MSTRSTGISGLVIGWIWFCTLSTSAAQDSQPLLSNASRVVAAMKYLGRPLPESVAEKLGESIVSQSSQELENLLDPLTLCTVTINPESRVKVERGLVPAKLQRNGFLPFLIKIMNQGAVKSPLVVHSPQAGPSYSGVAKLSMQRQEQLELLENPQEKGNPNRFLHLSFFTQPPMSVPLSGAPVEYAIMQIYSSEQGTREATLEFSVGSGTQDLGFRAELPLLFEIAPAIAVPLEIRDADGTPTFARLLIRDSSGNVYPPQSRRLAPDLFFQRQIYRESGEFVELPAGEFLVESSRGPEYHVQSQRLRVGVDPNHAADLSVPAWRIQLQRWVDPMEYGFYCGDHHIHGAGCAHYTNPTEGITPRDMFRQVAGEGLNVGCVLTWGPCFEHQRHFFRPVMDDISRPKTILKYDLEISGFGSQALGHVCLLNLKDQQYPGSDGTKEKGWPSWATPALKWARQQGAVTGYAHSASGLQIHPLNASQRMMKQLDLDSSGLLSPHEAQKGLLPEAFTMIDRDRDGYLSRIELEISADAAAERLPNLAVPEMDSVGAMELPVSVAAGVCDFISAMDTARIAEWNMWYHLLNCGYSLKASGETDFPCMSGDAVGQGRTYAFLGNVESISFQDWCTALAKGCSYVSDGYAHAFDTLITAGETKATLGGTIRLSKPDTIRVTTSVAFAPRMPESVAQGTRVVEGKKRFAGDTVTLHGTTRGNWVEGGVKKVELIVNGIPVAIQEVPSDGKVHDLVFSYEIMKSSWVAIRSFPQLHTNPIEIIAEDKPIRVSRASADWCIEVIKQLWSKRENNIRVEERQEAKLSFDDAIEQFRKRGREATE